MPIHSRSPHRKLWFTTGVAAIAAATTLGLSSPASAAPQYPVVPNVAVALVLAAPDPAAPPAGVNVPGCVPSPEHPLPVVMIPGLFGNMIDNLSGLGPTLANAGYCVYSQAFGDPSSFLQTTGPVADSAQQLSTLIHQVLATTGASKVDLVGYSTGGLISEYYLKLLGGAPYVNAFVGIAAATHGSTGDGLSALIQAFPGASALFDAGGCAACSDLLPGSAVLNAVDTGPIAQPGVSYTVIDTYYEEIVTPVGSSFINEPAVTNEWLQSRCPFDTTDHLNLTFDQGVYGLVENALDPAHAHPVACW